VSEDGPEEEEEEEVCFLPLFSILQFSLNDVHCAQEEREDLGVVDADEEETIDASVGPVGDQLLSEYAISSGVQLLVSSRQR